MNQLEAFNRLLTIIKKEERHEYYKETIKLNEDYECYSTNEGIDKKMQRLNSRQTLEAFEEQKRMTIHICSSIISNLGYIFNRVPDSQSIKTTYTDDPEFKDAMSKYTRDGLEGFLKYHLKDLIELDPNGWVVNETTGTDGKELAKVYPYIIESENAIMYEYLYNELLYLVDWREENVLNSKGATVTVNLYTIYTKEGVVKINELPDKANHENLKKTDVVDFIPEYFNLDRKSYEVIVPLPYNLTQVPARRVGYTYHKEYDDIYVNFYHYIMPFLDKIIKANSEHDIAYSKHVHPQKIQYQRTCRHDGCHPGEDGKYYIEVPDDNEGFKDILCPSCKGMGWTDSSTTGVEAIFFPLPQTKEEILDLSNIVHYVAVDINTPIELGKYVDHCIMMCRKIMFNQEDITVEDMAKQRTATELLINDRNRDDTLRAYALNYTKFFDFIIKTSAEYMQKSIEVIAEVSKDFNMRELPEWTNILQALTLAGANDFIINSVQWEIMRSLHGNSNASMEYQTRLNLIPFISMNKETKALYLSALPMKDKYKVAAIYGEVFLMELMNSEPKFLEMNYEKQKQLFDAKVHERITEIEKSEPKAPALPPLFE